ncbi:MULTISPECIES: SGNH/GDSL hydrolase family protein [environmental samples]|uniref:SGNH/GDSL hydrolase family protein n=1 Tax=environmental samples TaxID=876090 RepID=UPI000335F9F7|nr:MULTISPECIES: SGNH/GDSL hydrolase family protein [environmental samples]CDC68199.1 putative lipase/acylhydrolase [Oscillibacter sp. CAG:155]
MERQKEITLLGDSILKGIQVDPETRSYKVRNDIGIPELEAEFGLHVRNDAHFGATCVKGGKLLDRLLASGRPCQAVVMDFGGNDCDFRWREIAAEPAGTHLPAVPLPEFRERYRRMLCRLREAGIQPILMNLPPLLPQWFFDWWCRDLDQAAVRTWLGDLSNIYAHQERYSRAVESLAREEAVPLVDVRGAFLAHGHLETLLCEDGTHPNSAGQALIGQAFREFAGGRVLLPETA